MYFDPMSIHTDGLAEKPPGGGVTFDRIDAAADAYAECRRREAGFFLILVPSLTPSMQRLAPVPRTCAAVPALGGSVISHCRPSQCLSHDGVKTRPG